MEDQISAANMLVLRELLPVACAFNGRDRRCYPAEDWRFVGEEWWWWGHGGSVTVTQPTNTGATPLLHAAAYSGHLAVVQWLTGNGASPSEQIQKRRAIQRQPRPQLL